MALFLSSRSSLVALKHIDASLCSMALYDALARFRQPTIFDRAEGLQSVFGALMPVGVKVSARAMQQTESSMA